jgi:Uma2 family endonuclease
MAADPHRHHMTVKEYLELDQSSPDAKYEYIDGIAYAVRDTQALAGGTLAHARIALNLAILCDQLLTNNSCHVFTSDVRVQLSASRYVYPDLTISCEPTDWQADTIYDPRVIIEVLSPSTEAYDRGKKFAYYQQLASIQEYVLVNTQQQAIEVFTREGNAWHYQLYKAGEVAQLRSLTLSFALVDVYAHVPTDDDKI